MVRITNFSRRLRAELPETNALLVRSELTVHDSVAFITLHGSRGLRGRPRADSDVDLGLVVAPGDRSSPSSMLLESVLQTTLGCWRGEVEVDLAAIFDRAGCGLRCLRSEARDPECSTPFADCMGLYKTQRGFHGFVPSSLIDPAKMYPLLVIWQRDCADLVD